MKVLRVVLTLVALCVSPLAWAAEEPDHAIHE